jgi:hypothetical protein
MTTLADQLSAILDKRIPVAFEKGEVAMANMLSDQMEENTEKGIAFGSDPYDSVYRPLTVELRSAKGLQTGRVTLRETNHRIETTQVKSSKGQGATIRFAQGGKIFKEHHLGQTVGTKTSKELPIRSIWPKSHESVPKDIVIDTMTVVAEVLSGNR